MSEPKLITPLLDNYLMGAPISDHRGRRCCPALQKETEKKYFVKVISVPASQVQLDALLLSGAYPSTEAALKYFQELSNEITAEAALLQKLSRLEGFQSYEAWQIEPMEDGTGFDVYLLGEYVMTLERRTRTGGLTHLNAVNLGLDLCAALSVCRRNGFLYVDLKPENIVISENRGYQIGDIGFIRLSSLKYASLPEQYHSAYTAPEITDAFSALNTTIDTYAVGMILYQVFNDGRLPEDSTELTAPAYADPEMAQIILKACAADPADRWQDPLEMGQALVSYMQRNTVNDTPIVPLPEPEEPEVPEEPAEVIEEVPEPEIVEELPAEPEQVPVDIVEEPAVLTEEGIEVPEEVTEAAEVLIETPEAVTEALDADTETPEEVLESSDEIADIPEDPADDIEYVVEQISAILTDDAPVLEEVAPIDADTETKVEEPADASTDPEDPDQIAIEGFLFVDDVIPEDLPEGVVTDEVSSMLAQADELIAHKAPDPVVAPEPIDIPIPDPIVAEPEDVLISVEAAEAPEAPEDKTPADETSVQEVPAEEVSEEEKEEEEEAAAAAPRIKKPGCLVAEILALLLLVAAIFGGVHFYNNYYLQKIDAITPYGEQDWLTVTLDTQIDNSLLTVICTDTYGNRLTEKVQNNTATFTSLPSSTAYKITVEIDGFHQLTGATTATYSTAVQTNVVSFNAITGESNGSVILNFAISGNDSSAWEVEYVTDGEAVKTVTCSGHMANISGLTVGKTYTFRLVPVDDLYVVGNDTIEYTASQVIFADELTIHGFSGGILHADWIPSNNASVENWTVRCYNSTGYDSTFTVTEPSIAIEGLDITQAYSIEVKAAGMSVSRRADISANSITFKDILLDSSKPDQLLITWTYEGTAPEGGWQLVYTIDGSEPVTVVCQKNTYTLTDLIPGANYSFSFTVPEGVTVIGKEASYTTPDPVKFEGYTVSADNVIIHLCRKPDKDNWGWKDVPAEDFDADFLSTDDIGIVIWLDKRYGISTDIIEVLYVVRNADGSLAYTATYESTWSGLWYNNYCELDLPQMPASNGNYTLEIYFNDAYVTAEPIAFTYGLQPEAE